MKVFFTRFNAHFKYPITATENEITGKINIQFTVNENGVMSDYVFLNKLGYGIEDEILRVLNIIKQEWLPGEINNTKVNTQVEIPFNFTLK